MAKFENPDYVPRATCVLLKWIDTPGRFFYTQDNKDGDGVRRISIRDDELMTPAWIFSE
jgi:hypothetical protein